MYNSIYANKKEIPDNIGMQGGRSLNISIKM
jgi:hypothetical protein